MILLPEKIKNSNSFAAVVLLAPALIGILFFIIVPVFFSFGLSFVEWDLLSPIKIVGFSNYTQIFSDSLFYKILLNTFVFASSTSIIGLIIPLILACVLNNKIRGSEFFKTAYFLPFITPMIVIGMVWEWIFDPNIGLLNRLLRVNIAWLYDVHWAMPALIIVSAWKLIGYNMIIFLAGLSNLNNNIFEAAKVDGASEWQIFTKITVPMLSPTIFFVLIITTISSFQVFDLIYVMTQGGPFDSTNVLVYEIYKNAFEYFDVGRASAIAYILFSIILGLSIIQFSIKKKLI